MDNISVGIDFLIFHGSNWSLNLAGWIGQSTSIYYVNITNQFKASCVDFRAMLK
jgi:hypothetical protein